MVPKELKEMYDEANPVLKGVVTGLGVAGLIAATPAFAPVGAVGATGWLVAWGTGAITGLLDAPKWYENNYGEGSKKK